MSKLNYLYQHLILIILLFISLFFTFAILFPVNILANHPACDPNKLNTPIKAEGDNPEDCPPNTCYFDSQTNAATEKRYWCYEIQSQTTQPSFPQPIPPSKDSAQCLVRPKPLSMLTDNLTFESKNLTPNTNYQIQMNQNIVTKDNSTVLDGKREDDRRINSGASGKIKINIIPMQLNPALSSGTVSIWKVGPGKNFVCGDSFEITQQFDQIPPGIKWYRCDQPGNSCTESDEYKPGSFTTTDKNACDVQCHSVNLKCSEKDIIEGRCSSAGGDPCTTDPKNPGIATAIGCIHTNPAEFTKDILKFSIGIGGGLAFLMMLLGAYQMLTSAGNPDSLKAGQDRLTNAIIGLLIVIFSVLLMQIIGAGILNIPGFK